MADDHLPVQTHPAGDEAELAVAMRRLIEIHEVHVDAGPRQLSTELRVQVQPGLRQGLQPGNPHLGR